MIFCLCHNKQQIDSDYFLQHSSFKVVHIEGIGYVKYLEGELCGCGLIRLKQDCL